MRGPSGSSQNSSQTKRKSPDYQRRDSGSSQTKEKAIRTDDRDAPTAKSVPKPGDRGARVPVVPAREPFKKPVLGFKAVQPVRKPAEDGDDGQGTALKRAKEPLEREDAPKKRRLVKDDADTVHITSIADQARNDLVKLLQDIRVEQSADKKRLEDELASELSKLDRAVEEKRLRPGQGTERKKTLIQNHAKNLRDTGVTKQRVLDDRRFDRIKRRASLEVSRGGTIRQDGEPIFRLLSGADAFDPTPMIEAQGPIKRSVHRKFGKADSKRNQYVKDDEGVFTQRFAYVEKNKYQYRDLVGKGVLEGRYSTDPSSKDRREYNTFEPALRGKVNGLPADSTAFSSSYQLAYVHQELGSGPEQRGVSATSTVKHAVFSNQGESFKTEDGVRFELDLARIPHGEPGKPQLINHYSADARKKMEEAGITESSIQGPKKPREFQHYEWSVRKNRELFVKEIKPEYLTSVSLHAKPPTGTSVTKMTMESEDGLDLDRLTQLGEMVGVSQYQQGFAETIAGGASTATGRPSAYYNEGVKDAKTYLAGYVEGGSGKTADQFKKQLEDERWKQGYWDGYWGRDKRTL